MEREEREELCMIGRQLGTLNAEDIAFIMDETNGAIAVNRRMATARNRAIDTEMSAGKKVSQVMRIKHETLPVLALF